MTQLIIGIILVVAVLLVLVVLAQNSKGGVSALGSTGASQLMGAQRTADFLERLTWGLAIFLLVMSLGANVVKQEAGGYKSPNLESAGDAPVTAPSVPAATDTNAAKTNTTPAPATPDSTK